MKIIICDDSIVAQKSLECSIVKDDSNEILYASNGYQALGLMANNEIDILFLDLTMPSMDGFEVLACLPVNTYATKVVVVSGDVQKKAQRRCFELGAFAFVRKPFTFHDVNPIFQRLGLKFNTINTHKKPTPAFVTERIDPLSRFKEMTNIASGKGAAIVADHLDEFIQLPLPTVGYLSFGELRMAMTDVIERDNSAAVSQRFVGAGIHGEALVCIRGLDIYDIGAKLGYTQAHSTFNEVILNISNLLVSSYLVSLGEQLNCSMSLRQPSIVNSTFMQNIRMQDETQIFTIEYIYRAETLDFECEVLFLLEHKSVEFIYSLMESWT